MANIRKQGNTYQIRVSEGYDSKGKQVVRTRTWKPSEGMTQRQIEKELQKQALLFEEQCKKGVVTTNVKFEELAEKWFEDYAKPNLKKTTYRQMRTLTHRIYPAFGHLHIDKIKRGQIQAFIDDLAKNGKNRQTGKPLSSKCVVNHLNFLSDVFNYAVRLEMIENNPCKNIALPKSNKKEKSLYTIEEVGELLKMLETKPIKYRAFFTLAIYGGFRRGELLGLEWKDIDRDSEVVHIRRTSNYTAGTGNYTDTTKTKKSTRSLKLPPIVFEVLRLLQADNLEQKEKIGSKWTQFASQNAETDRLFIQWNGKPMSNNAPYEWLRRYCKNTGFRFCDVHSLRHFNASCLINAGVDVAAVSAALGHSTISTTTNIYTHIFDEAKARTCAAIAAALDFSKKQEDTTSGKDLKQGA